MNEIDTVVSGDKVYDVVWDSVQSSTARVQSIVSAQAVDDVSGSIIDDKSLSVRVIRIESGGNQYIPHRNALIPRISSGGIVGVIGKPNDLFPMLQSDSYKVVICITAEGYTPIFCEAVFDADPQFPQRFTSVNLGVVKLRRVPVVIHGSIVSNPGNEYEVYIDGYWRRMPVSSVVNAPEVINFLVMDFPVQYDWMDGQTEVIPVRNISVDSNSLELLEKASERGSYLIVDNIVPVAASDTLMIVSETAAVQIVQIESVVDLSAMAVGLAGRVRVNLANPLASAFGKGSRLHKVNLDLEGSSFHISDAAQRGDNVVFTDGPVFDDLPSLEGNYSGDLVIEEHLKQLRLVKLLSDDNRVEYCFVSSLKTYTDPSGSYRLPPIHRMAQVLLRAEPVGASSPNYQPQTRVVTLTSRSFGDNNNLIENFSIG